jgi:hypothetical protein
MVNQMKRTQILIVLLTIGAIITSCTKPKIIRELPEGNLTKLSPNLSPNTVQDEVAPVLIPSNAVISDPCEKENKFQTNLPFDGIITSKEFIKQALSVSDYNKEAVVYLTSNVESASFLTQSEGYASFSHPPNPKYAQRYFLPINGSIGGTDIFYFHPKENRIQFEVLPEPINTEFWDSHPFVTNDAVGNQLLIWASDRPDNHNGFSHPYKNEGNTDLYFAFKRHFEDWSEAKVHNFSEVLEDINTAYSEATPFLFCKCYNSILLFASNRDSKDSTYDIFYVKLEIDFLQQKITAKSKVNKLPFGEQNINTSADERFPYIPYPHITNYKDNLNIYLSSNRYKDSTIVFSKDSVREKINILRKNVGGYDIYRFSLDKAEFNCSPPPPPKLRLIVHLNEYCYDISGKNIVDSAINTKAKFRLNSQEMYTDTIYELQLGTNYSIESFQIDNGCSNQCDTCTEIKPLQFTTPKSIYKDTTIEITLVRNCNRKQAKEFFYSMKKGLAFFVTGYWYPTTTENLNELWSRLASGCLATSKFIDPYDFKPDEKDFYLKAAEINDAWLNNEFYPNIDSLLQKLDICSKKQKILITIQGFTDPCPLRTIRDQAGRITQDSTRFSCDETFVFEKGDEKIVIPQGSYMKLPSLMTTDGKPYNLQHSLQQGNYLLAMLRAHFTKETIIKGFKKKYSQNPDKIKLFDEFIVFNLDAFGIYDEQIKKCPEIDNDIVGIELSNKPYPPTFNEPCNLPHSRRVMIYVDVVNQSDLDKKALVRNECGKLTISQKVETSKEKTSIVPVFSDRNEEERQNLEQSLAQVSMDKPKDVSCPGKCFRVVFGPAKTTEEYTFLRNLLISLGFELDEEEGKNLRLVSKEKFWTEKDAMELIKKLRIELDKLTPLIDIQRVKAYIEQI